MTRPCVVTREVTAKRWTGARAGRAIEPRNHCIGCRRRLRDRKPHRHQRYRKLLADPARSENTACTNLLRENREVSCSPVWLIAGRAAQQGQGRNPEMNEHEKSDSPVLPTSPPNKVTRVAASGEEGLPREHGQHNTSRTQFRARRVKWLDRVREVARRDKDVRFTALLHHVDFSVWAAYWAIRPEAAPGVDR